MRGPSFQEPLQWLPESFFSLPFIIVRKQHKLALILTHHNPPTRRGMFLCLERQRKAETLMKCSPPLSGHLAILPQHFHLLTLLWRDCRTGQERTWAHWQELDKHSSQGSAALVSKSPAVSLLEPIENWEAEESDRAEGEPEEVCAQWRLIDETEFHGDSLLQGETAQSQFPEFGNCLC